jgi:acrylyl-CoA reductase (NADPH)
MGDSAPESLTLKESMMIGTSGLTAATGVEKILQSGRLSPEDDVLVTGATGAVGSFAVALLGHLGYTVTAATGKRDQAPFLKKIGASSVIHRDEVTSVSSGPLLKARWKAGVDTVGGSMLDAVLRQTKHNGVITCCGNVLGQELQTTIYPFILRGVNLMGIDTGIALMEDRLRLWGKLADGWKLPVLEELSREVQLENLPKEISKMLEGGQIGKVLVSLPR